MDRSQQRPGLWPRIQARASRILHRAWFHRSLRHIHGPRLPDAAPDEVIVVALIRDGMFYLDGFLDHYRSLGARHFVFFDNGSVDGSIERIRREPGTIIVQSRLPWGQYENHFRQYAAQRYCAGRWCLYADMDEIFEFDDPKGRGLRGLVGYLGDNGYTALVAQMLEMFPETALHQSAHMPYDAALQRYRYFDLGQIRAVAYHDRSIAFEYLLRGNSVADPDIRFLFGGVRRKVFGEDCCLTKHPLVFVGKGVVPGVHPHCASHVACADFTALIRHYKFTNDSMARDVQSVAAGSAGHDEDRQRLQVLQESRDVTLFSDQAIAFTGVADLVERGFLVGSARFPEPEQPQ